MYICADWNTTFTSVYTRVWKAVAMKTSPTPLYNSTQENTHHLAWQPSTATSVCFLFRFIIILCNRNSNNSNVSSVFMPIVE